MSAGATDATRLAAALLGAAKRTFHAVGRDGEARAAVATAVKTFTERPAPATYLAAVRALAGARRAAVLRRFDSATDERLFARGLEALRQVRGLDAPVIDRLAALPRDARSGRRLVALALLLETQLELAGRASAAVRALRERIGR